VNVCVCVCLCVCVCECVRLCVFLSDVFRAVDVRAARARRVGKTNARVAKKNYDFFFIDARARFKKEFTYARDAV